MKPSIRFEIFKRDAFTCVYCGRKSPDVVLEVDHILPLAQGGGDELDNLVSSCVECNRGKAARILDRVPPPIDIPARAEALREREAQIAAYALWKVEARDREDADLERVRKAFSALPTSTFYRAKEERWAWNDISVRGFLRRLNVYDVLDAVDATAAKMQAQGWRPSEQAADVTWRYFCGCCWRAIRGPKEKE